MEFIVQVKLARESLPFGNLLPALRSSNGNGHGNGTSAKATTVEPLRGGGRDMYSLKVTMQSSLAPNGVRVLYDRSEANLDSMKVALMALTAVPLAYNSHSWAVLGDMDDADFDAAADHRALGQFCADHYIDRLVCVGAFATHIAAGTIEGGVDEENVQIFRTSAQALAFLDDNVSAGDVVLVKGSRAIDMGKIVVGMCSM